MLPKTASFDNIDFMSASMTDTFIKGSDDIKSTLDTLVLSKGAEAVAAAEKLSGLLQHTRHLYAYLLCR